jgi:hypothetical protein
MKRTANLLLRAAGVIGLLTFGFVGSLGRVSADEAPRKVLQGMAQEAQRNVLAAQQALRQLVQDKAVVQQLEQQFAPQFRQLYRTELHFLRLVCQPTKPQYEKIAADTEPALKAATRDFALKMRQGRAIESFDPRTLLTDALAQAVRTTLSPEQAARYQEELDQRAAARKRFVLRNLVAKVDKVLLLTAEQRDKLGALLEDNWKESWNQPQMLMHGHYFPPMPDVEMRLLLTEAQRNVWAGVQKNVRFGFDLGIVQGIEIEDEVWDDDQPQEPPGQAKGKAAKPGE